MAISLLSSPKANSCLRIKRASGSRRDGVRTYRETRWLTAERFMPSGFGESLVRNSEVCLDAQVRANDFLRYAIHFVGGSERRGVRADEQSAALQRFRAEEPESLGEIWIPFVLAGRFCGRLLRRRRRRLVDGQPRIAKDGFHVFAIQLPNGTKAVLQRAESLRLTGCQAGRSHARRAVFRVAPRSPHQQGLQPARRPEHFSWTPPLGPELCGIVGRGETVQWFYS